MIGYNPYSSIFYKRSKKSKKHKKYTFKGASEMTKLLKDLAGITKKIQSVGESALGSFEGKENMLHSEAKEISNELNEVFNKDYKSKEMMILKQEELIEEERQLIERQSEIADQLIIAEIEGDQESVVELENELNELEKSIGALKVKGAAYGRLAKSPIKNKERKKVSKLYAKYKKDIVNTDLYEGYGEVVKEFSNLMENLQKFTERLNSAVGGQTSHQKFKQRFMRTFNNNIGVRHSDVLEVFEKYGIKPYNYERHREENLFLYVGIWLESEKEKSFRDFFEEYVYAAVQQGRKKEIELNQIRVNSNE